MSAILSASDLNDFISPGVACIKPVESLPAPAEPPNPYEVTTEDKLQAANPPPASITLADCLACSGCVTSAEAVLISLQSHVEVQTALEAGPSITLQDLEVGRINATESYGDGKLFVASVSPQVRASLAATYNITSTQAGNLISQFLAGPKGLRSGGAHGNGFSVILDTNRMREASLALGVDEVAQSLAGTSTLTKPILTSACPGWICYAEKTHPHILPHLSRLKSPQALSGVLLKSVLSKAYGIHPSRIWHLAIMPCFDKKLEASREELTDRWWTQDDTQPPVRDVDCVITSRELLLLAADRNILLQSLPLTPPPLPDPFPAPLATYLFPLPFSPHPSPPSVIPEGTSGGFLAHLLTHYAHLHPGSTLITTPGRNTDTITYTLLPSPSSPSPSPILTASLIYGFRNITNLVRRLKPPRTQPKLLPGSSRRPQPTTSTTTKTTTTSPALDYVEVMACPGGCTNGGGQIRVDEVATIRGPAWTANPTPASGPDVDAGADAGADADVDAEAGLETRGPRAQKGWLKRVDSAYFATGPHAAAPLATSEGTDPSPTPHVKRLETETETDTEMIIPSPRAFLAAWSAYVDVSLDKLAYTSYRAVESDVGKGKGVGDMERVASLAGSIGGGW